MLPSGLVGVRARNVPIRLFLILPVLADVFVVVTLVGWLTVRNGQKAVNQVTQQLREETTARINHEVSELLTTTQTINQLSAQTIERENLDISNIRALDDVYWDYINTFPNILGLGVGNESGDIMALFQRVENGETRYFLEFSNAQTENNYVSLELDRQRQIIGSTTVNRYIDARERPWYRAAVRAGRPVWTEVYTSVSEVEGHSLAINASQPIYADDGQLQGVVSVILDLGQISQILENIAFSPSGEIYILEVNGDLIGSSDGRNPVAVNGESAKRLQAMQSESRLIRESAVFLNEFAGGDFGTIEEAVQLDFDLAGDRQFLQVTPIRESNQLQWWIAVVVPESDFMEPIYANTRTILLLCVGALAFTAGSSVLIAYWITTPLRQLNRATRHVAQGNLHQGEYDAIIATARAREVSELAVSFSQMVEQLQTAFSQLQQLNADLADSESRLKQFLEALPVGAAVYNSSGQMTYINQAGKALLGIEDLSNQDIAQLNDVFRALQADTTMPYPVADMPITRAFNGESTYIEDMDLRRADRVIPIEMWGSPIFNDQGTITYAIAAFQDISDRKQAEAQLIYSALHDALTDLPNRAFLMNRLDLAIKRIQQSETYHFAVLFLDLDQFKIINDSLGHLAGDQLLINISQKLKTILRPADLAARLGGDEFVILLEHMTDVQAAVQMAERILDEFEGTTSIDGYNVFITTSIGIVWGTDAYTEASDLLRDADIALYRAKAQGRARYEIFDTEMHIQAVKRMNLEHDLRQAIAQQAFTIHYQPIIQLNPQHLVGFEALIRWQHPTRGIVSPMDFIPIAEETGLIGSISQWVLQASCQQLTLWQQQFPEASHLKISVNLSGQDLRCIAFAETVQRILEQTSLNPESLTLEITESMLIENIDTTIQLLRTLRESGIRISIDDFGTGYSSLSYLYRLPADYLKIDKSFVGNMHQGDNNSKIVQAIISLSNQLQIEAIAEGIETEQQLQWLADLGCELGQGYYLSRPLTPEAATDYLRALG